MKLTTDQEQLVADWVRQKIENQSCSLCSATHWKVGELLHSTETLAVDEFDAVSNHGMVQLICQNCGHVLLFDVRSISNWRQHDTSHPTVM